MPIYEYESLYLDKGCDRCSSRFEIIQGMNEEPLSVCPHCGAEVRKVISWCRAAVVETSDEHIQVEKQVSEYESHGMWSHAAELADKHSEEIKDKGMKTRALDNYKKAGYELGMLEKHSKNDNDWL
ncbi:MAG: zinc ribbon domain-containing protein [Desulfatiglans sp.]|jgi:putative FmdB family regulatory protein|nr:zinc ribbon domain-containing protein [Thermodesulfobacteriota bacterium]MEE4353708.1 zinc ribbon domain-containing protein [Desulfatiglans sp.]